MVMRRALVFQVENLTWKRTWKKREGSLEHGRCALPIKVDCWH